MTLFPDHSSHPENATGADRAAPHDDHAPPRPTEAAIEAPRGPRPSRLFLAAVFFISVQIEVGGGLDVRLAPSDLFLALALITAPSLFLVRRGGVDLLPVLLIGTLCVGVMLSVVQTGGVNNHTLLVKLLGGIVLALLSIVTASVARAGYADQLIRVFLIGMAVWAVVAWVDWRVVDIFPFVDAKTDSRFGAMQYDPNNAGAAYGVALIISWKLGARTFRHRAAHVVCTMIYVATLGLTLSRGGYVSTLAAGLVLVAIDPPNARQLVRALWVGLILLSVAIMTGFAGTAIDDFTNRPDNVGDRSQLAQAGLRDLVDSNGTGIGLGTYRAAYEQVIHNTGLWLLVEMSLVGFAFMVALVVFPFVGAYRLRNTDPALGSALLGAHTVMVVASQNIEALYQRQWWLVIGLIAGSLARSTRAGPADDHHALDEHTTVDHTVD